MLGPEGTRPVLQGKGSYFVKESGPTRCVENVREISFYRAISCDRHGPSLEAGILRLSMAIYVCQ
jgi:hypothetical protein